MKTLKVGLIPAPDLPARIIDKIINYLKQDLENHVSDEVNWKFETVIDPFTGAAEYVDECIDKAVELKETHEWDYAICLTDLPSFSNHKAVIADVTKERGVALISLPSFGAFPLKKRIRKALIYIVEELYGTYQEEQSEEKVSNLNWRFLFSKIKRIDPGESSNTDTQFILTSAIIGWLRILSGMTFANRPWLALSSFKKILTLAFATGTYISIFSTPWQLSIAYSPLRFSVLMLVAIGGMITWIIFAHNLWEKASSKSQSNYRLLYNITTVTTLMIITIINYIALFGLFAISISLFVPEGIFDSWTNIDAGENVANFMRLGWLVTSLGLLAGAVGAAAEKEEKVRRIAYSYRQRERIYEIEQQEEDSSSTKANEGAPSQRDKQDEDTLTVGIIAAPELAAKLAYDLVEELPDAVHKHLAKDTEYIFEVVVDSLTGAAETAGEIFQEASSYRKEKTWNYIICLTDLPVFHEKNVVAVDINENTYTSLISIPAFGWRPVKKRVRKSVIHSLKEMHQLDSANTAESEKPQSSKMLRRQFPIAPIKRVRMWMRQTNDYHTRFLVIPSFNGKLRLLSGMTFANNPFKMMSSLTSVIAVAFTTGAFGMIFTTMWKLSHLFSILRLSTITAAAIIGMLIWIIVAHELWEPVSSSKHKRIIKLYNSTTILTLLISVAAYYVIVFLLFSGASLVLLPPEFLGKTLELDKEASLMNYLKISWFAASISTVAGAIGAGLENEELVRDSTYGYRQSRRYQEVHKNDSNNP